MEKCRFCHDQDIKTFLPGEKFKLLKCQRCGIISTSPFPSEKDLMTFNENRYGQKSNWQEYLSRLPLFLKRAKKIIVEIQKFKKRGKFLDIGCGFGLLLKAAKEQGFDVLGIEKEIERAKIAKEKFNLQVLAKEFNQIQLSKSSFDVISCFDVLEHIPEPKKFLKTVGKLLKKNGLLVIQSPNIESVMARTTGVQWNWLLLPNHLWHFTPKTLSTLLTNNGFEILKSKTLDDLSEFNFNLIDVLGIKKTNLLAKIIWKVLRIGLFGLAPLSFIWSKLGKGGLIRIYAQKK